MPTVTDNPVVTLDDLKAAYASTAWALNEADVTQAALDHFNADYDKGLTAVIEAWEMDHADLMTARQTAKAAHEAAKARAAAQKEALKGLTALYWLNHRDDEKPLAGLAKRDSVVATVRPGQDGLLHMQLREYAPYLLKVDEKLLAEFVKANAIISPDGTASLPSPMSSYLNALVPAVRREPTVSDTTLIKNAPATDPDILTPEDEAELEAIAVEQQDADYERELAEAVAAGVSPASTPNNIGDIPF